MTIEPKTKAYFEEFGAQFSPATPDQIEELSSRNADGDTLTYFSTLNIAVELPARSICLDDAMNNLDMMDGIAPDCEVWQHGFIPVARDIEGRVYCFDQNSRDADGHSKIVRHPYPIGDDATTEDAKGAAEPIADNFELFLEWIMEDSDEE